MKQKKQTHHSKPHGTAESYANKQHRTRQAYIQATADTYRQYIFDLACIVLHLEFGWGQERVKRFGDALSKAQIDYDLALRDEDETGYKREIMDRNLREIFGDELLPFEQRYCWVRDII